MNGRPWYKRYGGDFVFGAMSLTLEEKGAYSLCLDLIYDRGGPIPDDARWLAGVCGVSVRRWRTLRARLIDAGKIVARDGHITNSRAEREIAAIAEASREAAENGAKGGRKRAENELKKLRKSSEKEPDLSKNNDLGQANQRLETRGQNIDDDGGGARDPAPADQAVNFALAAELAATCGYPDPKDWPPGWCGAPHWVQKCLSQGWDPAVMRSATMATVKRKRDGPIEHFVYLEKPLARAMALHRAPLPDVEISQGGQSGQKSNGIIAAADRLVERIKQFDAPLCGGEGQAALRVLPDGRRERPGDLHGGNRGDPGGVPADRGADGDGPSHGHPAPPEMAAHGGGGGGSL